MWKGLRALAVLLVLYSLPLVLGGASSPVAVDGRGSCEASTGLVAQQGCCSYHKGVCGCLGGAVQCCDGTSSPSCRCQQLTQSFEPDAFLH
jgi:hypothetical protein